MTAHQNLNTIFNPYIMFLGLCILIVIIGVVVVRLDGASHPQGRGESSLSSSPKVDQPSSLAVTPLALRRAYFAIRRKGEFVQEQLKEMGYQRRELHLQQWGNDLFWREHVLENQQQKLDLTAQEMEITNLHRELGQKKVGIEQYLTEKVFGLREEELKLMAGNINLQQNALKVESQSLENMKKEVELTGQEIAQQVKQQLFDLANQEIGLKRFELDLFQQSVNLDREKVHLEEKALDNKKKEIELTGQAMSQKVQEAALHLQAQIVDFKEQKFTFREQVASTLWGIKVKNDMLSIRTAKTDLLERRVNQMYWIKSEWLRIEAKENRQNYSDQQHQLKKLYDETMSKIRELRLVRWENNLHWDQKEVDRKRKIMQYIEEKWTAQYKNGRTYWITQSKPREALNDLMRSGYQPESPLIPEIKKLEEEKRKLRNKLLQERNQKGGS